ncbi:MAG: ATP-binding cassette domain-containing protein [Sulfolobaceae archaeon]
MVKIYESKVKALDGISLEVYHGESFALLGPNGAGKTTLIRILTTQISPTYGEAYVNGYSIRERPSEVRKVIGYVPQEISVWTDLTAYDNLLIYSKIYNIPSSERKSRIEEVLDKFGLYEVRNELVKTYSGGMIRRLEIACALLIKPKILFLDEPTIGLDPAARKVVWQELKNYKEEHGITIFFTTHYMDEADTYSDRIALISKGKVIKVGTSEELKKDIGGSVISFTVENAEGLMKSINILSEIRDIQNVSVNNEMGKISIITKNVDVVLPLLIDFLRMNKIKYSNLEVREVTLDDVFIKYVGESIEVRGRSSEVRQIRSRIRRG